MATNSGNGNGGDKRPGLPAWRFAFFAILLFIVVVGGSYLQIPREVAIPVIFGAFLALANGTLPTWFGKGKDKE